MGRNEALTALALIIIGCILPLVLREYHLNLLTEVFIFALFAVSFNLLLGYGGLLSFGHGMFFGIGAFVAAIAITHLKGISLLTCLLLTVTGTTLIGLAVGMLLLRLKGGYFAMLTLAFNALFYAIATKWTSVTGGDDGLNITRPAIDLLFTQFKVGRVTSFYYVTLLVIGAVIIFCWFFTQTAMGQTVVLMRENEERMRFIGFNTAVGRLILLTFSGALAGLAGGFFALHFQFVSVSAIGMQMGWTALLIAFVGGTRTFWGPILGAFVYIILQNYLSDLTDRWALIMGLIFVLMVLFVPGGLSGVIMSAKNWVISRGKDQGKTIEEQE
jgi:branched-chain amino acid transport system permease protein